jgi:hypothetical protein
VPAVTSRKIGVNAAHVASLTCIHGAIEHYPVQSRRCGYGRQQDVSRSVMPAVPQPMGFRFNSWARQMHRLLGGK